MARYDRASIDDTIRAARISATRHNADRYVFATAYGYTIWHEPPPGSQRYILVTPSGNATTQQPFATMDEQPTPSFAAQQRLF